MNMPTKYYRLEVCVKLNECNYLKLWEKCREKRSVGIFFDLLLIKVAPWNALEYKASESTTT